MEGQSYSTNMSDGQWARIERILPLAKNGRTGRPRKYSKREVVNALFYIVRTGCQWRNLRNDLPPYTVVWDHFFGWRNDGTLDRIHDALRTQARCKSRRHPAPSAAILDSQSVKTTEKGGQEASMRARK